MRYGCLLFVIIVLVTLAIVPPLITPDFSGEGQFIYENSANIDINLSTIEAEAEALTRKGVTVAIYVVNTGNHEDLIQRLEDENLMSNARPNNDVLALYIGIDNRYSEIAWGAIDTINIAQIRHQAMNPNLRDSKISLAITDSLGLVTQRLENPYAVILPSMLYYINYLIFDSPSWLQVLLILVIVFGLILTTEKRPASGSYSYEDNSYSGSTSSSSSSSSYDSSSDSSSNSSGFDGGSWDD